MKHFEDYWLSADQLEIYSQGWEPITSPIKGTFCLVHGLGEHSGRYEYLAEKLTKAGFTVMSFDLRGHGKSAGQRGHVSSSEEFLIEIDQILQHAHERFPSKPRFLYGHSLGGLLVLFYVIKRRPEITGVVASSPGLRSSLQEQRLKVALTKSLAGVLPKLSIDTGLVPEYLSRDKKIVMNYIQDSLVHHKATLQMARTILEMIEYVSDHTQDFKPPLLIMHGTADQIVYPSGSIEFASKVQCPCNIKLWEGFFHEIHNEPGKEEIIDYMISWLEGLI